MCTKPASSNQMWPFYARTFLLNTCQPSAGSKIWEQDGNKQKALHTATAALKGGGGERKGKMGEENEQNGTLKRLNQSDHRLKSYGQKVPLWPKQFFGHIYFI